MMGVKTHIFQPLERTKIEKVRQVCFECVREWTGQANLYVEDTKFRSREEKLGVSQLFFDGEEAFKDWTATDSIYGAR